jgi:hypothetical protein
MCDGGEYWEIIKKKPDNVVNRKQESTPISIYRLVLSIWKSKFKIWFEKLRSYSSETVFIS